GTSTTTGSPVISERLSLFLKNSFLPFLNRTSTISKRSSTGSSILDSQSKTFILLQPPVRQAPLFSQPATFVPLPEPHEHAMSKYLFQFQQIPSDVFSEVHIFPPDTLRGGVCFFQRPFQ